MIFQVKKGNTITEYYVLDIDRERLEELKSEILAKYSTTVHCEYIDSTFPMESDRVRNVQVSKYSDDEELPLFRIEADFITYPTNVIDAINGALIGSGKGLTDLMSLNAIDNPLVETDILEELRGIASKHSDGDSLENTMQEVLSLSERVVATDLETEALYSQLKSCVKASVHSVRSVQTQHKI